MPLAVPRPLRSALAVVLTTWRPSLRLVGWSGQPACRELEAFLRALAQVPAGAPTACDGWTAHELVAHLAAGSEEMTRLVHARLAGGPEAEVGPTRDFESREAPYRAMGDRQLRRRFIVEGLALTDAIVRLAASGPGVTVPFTGWDMTAAELIRHGQSELILHRWDLVGSDAVALRQLDQAELLAHATKVSTHMDGMDAAGVDDGLGVAASVLAHWGRDQHWRSQPA